MASKETLKTEGQGAFFTEQVHTSGGTDPAIAKQVTSYEPVADGFFPEDVVPEPHTPTAEELALSESVSKENRKAEHRKAQVGIHSPLERTGRYSDFRLGDVLPDFGPVTNRNWDDARQYAEELDAKRKKCNLVEKVV